MFYILMIKKYEDDDEASYYYGLDEHELGTIKIDKRTGTVTCVPSC